MLKLKTYLLALFILASNSSNAQFWNLVWSDEFDGSSINTNNWTFEIGTGSNGWGNNELQFYTSRTENAQIINNELAIIARKENYSGRNYTSARMITMNKHSWQYGKIEARIRIPKQQGLWPAFWGLGDNFPTAGWPHCGEIDIMEHINTNETIHGTMHWDAGGYATYGGDTILQDVNQYHIYSIEWDDNVIRWFVDGIQYHVANISNNINSTNEFHQNYFLILNMAVGGNWPGSPNSNFTNDTLFVDYVRVYQDGLAPTSVNNMYSNNRVQLYPNPVAAHQTIKLNSNTIGEHHIQIIGLDGKMILEVNHLLSNQEESILLATDEFKSGIYFLRLQTDKGQSVHKLLIQ